jgi:hypothetical protein
MNAPSLETTEKTPSTVVTIQEVARDIRMGGTQRVPGLEVTNMMGSIAIAQDTLKTRDVEMEEKKGSIMIGPGMGERKVRGTGKERMMGDILKAVQDTQKVLDIRITVILRDQGTPLVDQDSVVVEEMEKAGTLNLHAVEMTAVDITVEKALGIVGKIAVDTIKLRVTSMGEMTQKQMTWQRLLQ